MKRGVDPSGSHPAPWSLTRTMLSKSWIVGTGLMPEAQMLQTLAVYSASHKTQTQCKLPGQPWLTVDVE